MTKDPKSRGSNGNDHLEEVDDPKVRVLELEYTTLRKEIEDSRERGFKIIVGAVLAAPAAQFLAEEFNVDIFKLFIPLIVLSFYLLWLAEHLAISRCAQYIVTIERRMKRISPEVEGWEHWLRDESVDRRAHEKYLGYAFNFLSIGIYGAATLMAASALVPTDKGDPSSISFHEYVTWPTPLLLLVLYTCIGLIAAAFIQKIPRGYEAAQVQEVDAEESL